MSKKVLVVDNNKVFMALLCRFFEDKGYEVQTAEDGLAALNVLESFVPELMIVDLVMPLIDGERLCRIVRKMPELDNVALVIVSAIAAEAKIDFAAFGADACIAKGPFQAMRGHLDEVLAHLATGKGGIEPGTIYGADEIYERQITKELVASGKHFEVAMDHMADGFLEMTSSGSVTYANRMAAQLLAVPEERLLAASFASLFEEKAELRFAGLLNSLGQKRGEVREEEAVVAGRHLLLKFVPFSERGRQAVIVLMQDITRRKQAELELQRHRDQLEGTVAERTAALAAKNAELEAALAKVKTLSGLLPICASCKKIRDDKGYWNQIEVYITNHSEAAFSHSLCPHCARTLYPDVFNRGGEGDNEK